MECRAIRCSSHCRYHLAVASPFRFLVRDSQLIDLSYELPLEILNLAVEERSVVLTLVRAEEAVRTVGRGDRPHAPQRRHVGPAGVASATVAIAPAEGGGSIQVGRRGDLEEAAIEEVLRIRRRPVLRGHAVVVVEARLGVCAPLEAGRPTSS